MNLRFCLHIGNESSLPAGVRTTSAWSKNVQCRCSCAQCLRLHRGYNMFNIVSQHDTYFTIFFHHLHWAVWKTQLWTHHPGQLLHIALRSQKHGKPGTDGPISQFDLYLCWTLLVSNSVDVSGGRAREDTSPKQDQTRAIFSSYSHILSKRWSRRRSSEGRRRCGGVPKRPGGPAVLFHVAQRWVKGLLPGVRPEDLPCRYLQGGSFVKVMTVMIYVSLNYKWD